MRIDQLGQDEMNRLYFATFPPKILTENVLTLNFKHFIYIFRDIVYYYNDILFIHIKNR